MIEFVSSIVADTILAFLASMRLELMTLHLQGGHTNHLIKVWTASQVASG